MTASQCRTQELKTMPLLNKSEGRCVRTTSKTASSRLSLIAFAVTLSLCALVIIPNKMLAQEIMTSEEGSSQFDLQAALDAVTDQSWLTSDDGPAYYGLLDRASNISPRDLASAGTRFVQSRIDETHKPTFVDMLQDPKAFRGQPVTLSGHVLQTIKYEAEANEYGIEHLYEVSLFTPDSQGHPTTVVFTEKPPELSIGGELVEGVTASGYFLKMYRYDSADNHTRVAPLILARTIKIEAESPPEPPGWLGPVMFSGFALSVCLLIGCGAYWYKSDRQRLIALQRKRLDAANPQFDPPQN